MENKYLDYEGLKHLIDTQEAAEVDPSTYIKQYSVMPEAGEDYLNEIAQYVGTTTADFNNGYFYKCVSDGETIPTYSWVEVMGAGEKEVVHVDYPPVAPDVEDKVYIVPGNADSVNITLPAVADFETYMSQFDFLAVIDDFAIVSQNYAITGFVDGFANYINEGFFSIAIDNDDPGHDYVINYEHPKGEMNVAQESVGNTITLHVLPKSRINIYVGDSATQSTILVSGGSSVEVDNDTIVKDANDVISVSPKFIPMFKGTRAQWRALTAEQKAVYATGLVSIIGDYDDSGSGVASIDDWSQEIPFVVQQEHTGTYYYEQVNFDRPIAPNSISIYKTVLPRSSGNMLNMYVNAVGKGRLGSISNYPSAANMRLSDCEHYIIITNTTSDESKLWLQLQGNASSYPSTDNIIYCKNCNLDEAKKTELAESLVDNAKAHFFTISD